MKRPVLIGGKYSVIEVFIRITDNRTLSPGADISYRTIVRSANNDKGVIYLLHKSHVIDGHNSRTHKVHESNRSLFRTVATARSQSSGSPATDKIAHISLATLPTKPT
jgi:hypothetical protein